MKPNRPTAFVLMMTLVLLAVAAIMLTAVSRLSLRQVLVARAAQDQLQRRWGTLSCRSTLLPQTELVLAMAEAQSSQPVATLRVQLPLGSQTFDLIFTDEQAKVNINALLGRRDPESVAAAVRALLRVSSIPLTVRLSPLPLAGILGAGNPKPGGAGVAGNTVSGGLPGVGSWSQVFAGANPGDLIGSTGSPDYPVADVTCWGGGKLNYRRASRAALEQACAPVLDSAKVGELLDLRHQFPGIGLDKLLELIEIKDNKRDRAIEMLAGGSSCHGLWVVSHSGDHAFYSLSIWDEAAKPTPRDYCLTW